MSLLSLYQSSFLTFSRSISKFKLILIGKVSLCQKDKFQNKKVREDIKKQYKEWNWYHLPYPSPPLLKEWKTKEWNICMFDTPPPPPLLRVKNLLIFKVHCITFVVTFQCSEISLTSSESKQDETRLDKSNTQCR